MSRNSKAKLSGLLFGDDSTGGGIFLTPLLLLMRWARTKIAAAVSAPPERGPAAWLLRVSRRTIYTWMQKGYVPYIRVGRSLRFDWKLVSERLSARFGRGPGLLLQAIHLKHDSLDRIDAVLPGQAEQGRPAENRGFSGGPEVSRPSPALFPVLIRIFGLIRVLRLNRLVGEQHRERFPVVAKADHILFHFDARGAIEPFIKH